jgi:chorismate synthase
MVAAGAVAKKWLLESYGAQFQACIVQIGEVPIQFEELVTRAAADPLLLHRQRMSLR